MKTPDRIVINIIGIGYDLCIGELNAKDYEVLVQIDSHKKALNYLLFEEDFYLQNEITENYKTWRDFDNIAVYSGANVCDKGQIEIWVNRKRKKTYSLSEINNSTLLFPMFNFKEEYSINKSGQIIVGVQEKGHLNRYQINTENFSIDQLTLNIIDIKINSETIKILYSLSYKGILLNNLKNDTVITGTFCEITKNNI